MIDFIFLIKVSPGREITAKDIMSGIISAANRKMHRHSKVRERVMRSYKRKRATHEPTQPCLHLHCATK